MKSKCFQSHITNCCTAHFRQDLSPTSNASARQSVGLTPRGNAYDGLKQALKERAFGDEASLPQWLGATPEQVAQVIVRAVQAKRPRTRYTITAIARLLPAMRHVIPDRLWDAMTRRQFGFQQAIQR